MSPRVHPRSPEWPGERVAWLAAGRVAQAAHSLQDLAALVTTHDDFRVRCAAIPRLRARFPDDKQTLVALAEAARAFDPVVRETALGALGDIGGKAAADVIVARMTDRDAEVRAAAGQALAQLGDPRAPSDLDEWLRLNRSADYEDCGE